MFVDVEGAWELLRGVPVPCCMFLSVILLSAGVGPVGAVHEFTGYRMQHFDLHGIHYGQEEGRKEENALGRGGMETHRLDKAYEDKQGVSI